MTESTATKGSETRQRIVERAFLLASTVGLEGLSIGGLARDLGLSKSGLFAHFRSKEQLQLDVLSAAADHFRRNVVLPALKQPRGQLRIIALFEAWLLWVHSDELPGGCIFLAAAAEWDDREGIVREELVKWFDALRDGLVRAAQIAVDEGEFNRKLDTELFAYEWHGIVLKYHLDCRLLRSERSERLARSAFGKLVSRAT